MSWCFLASVRGMFLKQLVWRAICLKKLCFASNLSPFMDKRPKEVNQSRTMIQMMMFREQMAVWKKCLVSLAMFTDFTLKICNRVIRVDRGYNKLHYVLEIQNNMPYRFILWNKWTNNQRQQSKQRPIFMSISTNAFIN